MSDCLIALGSNQGNRADYLYAAIDRLAAVSGIRIQAIAPFIKTDPVDMPNSTHYFLNTAVVLEVACDPESLLVATQAIERSFGQQTNKSNLDRVIDIDIIGYDDCCIHTDSLCIPHPRYHTRLFVLEPLSYIAPTWRDPQLGLTIQALYAHVSRETV